MKAGRHKAAGPVGRWVTAFEETAIAVLLGLMTLVTFANVVLRYGFNTSLIWGLEVTLILFAWLVLFGISYGFKVTAHLGVDAVINLFGPGPRKVLALVAAALCIVYAALLMKGAWDYWAPYAAFDRTSGRWFPTGFVPTRDQAWYITDQVPMLDWLRWLEPLINQGEEYEKLPRVIPYAMLPLATLLLLIRLCQATWRIWTGAQESLIVSHEAEDAVDEVAARNAAQERT
ncbi:TRAP transporter small permease [Rhodobacteraceae bacterium CCMM004]|nr:TRAP transporter small permease [Rhodobacteraceae bacterium CCMM004]